MFQTAKNNQASGEVVRISFEDSVIAHHDFVIFDGFLLGFLRKHISLDFDWISLDFEKIWRMEKIEIENSIIIKRIYNGYILEKSNQKTKQSFSKI